MGRTFGGFREQATGKYIWRFSRTGYWGGHLQVFENRLMGEDIWRFSRTGCWGGHLEVFENRLLRNIFADIWKWAVEENISKCSRTGYWPGHLMVLRTGCWAGHLEVFKKGLLKKTFGGVREQAEEEDILPTLVASFVKYFAYKSNDVRAGQAELMGQRRNAYKRIVWKPKNLGLLGEFSMHGRIKLQSTLKE